MKNLPKEKRDRLILLFLGTCAVLAGLYFGLISIQQKSLEAMLKRRKEQETKLSNGQRLASDVSKIQRNLEEVATRLKAIESTMPSGDMYSWVILTVNTFKENYKVEIPQFSREVPAEVGMFPGYPYRAAIFNLRGTPRQVLGRYPHRCLLRVPSSCSHAIGDSGVRAIARVDL